MRSWPVVSPPWKGWAEVAALGQVGGLARPRLDSSGLWRLAMMDSRVSGIVKGGAWGGIVGGKGGSFEGLGRTRLGASRRGSTFLR